MNLDSKKCQHVKNGKQCGAYPLRGTNRCVAHTKYEQDYITGYSHTKATITAQTKSRKRIPMENYNDGEFFSVPNRITDHDIAKYLEPVGIAVLLSICSHIRRFSENGEKRLPMSFPKIATIASECGCDPRRVRSALDRLIKCNVLMVVRKWKHNVTGQVIVDTDFLVGKGWEPTSNNYYLKSQDVWKVPS